MMDYYHEKFPIVRDMISVLYDYCNVGGCCHIVTDDDNIYDEDLDYVIEYAQREENKNRVDSELSIAICKILKSMTFLQRAVLFDSYHSDFAFDYHNKKDFDDLFCMSEEELKTIYRTYDWDNRLPDLDD